MRRLVIIAASAARNAPSSGRRLKARDAYARYPYETRRSYAEQFGDGWLIFSTKWGLLAPSTLIDPTYTSSGIEVDPTDLLRQLREHGADTYDLIEVLAGKAFVALLRESAHALGTEFSAPLNGRGLKLAQQSVEIQKRLRLNVPFIV